MASIRRRNKKFPTFVQAAAALLVGGAAFNALAQTPREGVLTVSGGFITQHPFRRCGTGVLFFDLYSRQVRELHSCESWCRRDQLSRPRSTMQNSHAWQVVSRNPDDSSKISPIRRNRRL